MSKNQQPGDFSDLPKRLLHVYELSDFLKRRIELGRQQINDGQTISNDDFQNEIDHWLRLK
jgi:hypothetical protein